MREVQPGRIVNDWSFDVHQRRLLLGLEKARTRLAVAVASDRKATPLPKRGIYFQTDERMRRCVKRMRADGPVCREAAETWLPALDALDRLLGSAAQGGQPGEAEHLHRRLSEILEFLENLTS